MKILVIGGGISKEREVSLESSKTVHDACRAAGYESELYDWDGSVQWLQKSLSMFDTVLPILHGKGGEDGQIQQLLENSGTPFLGANAANSAICFNKQETLKRLKEANFDIPTGGLVTLSEYKNSDLYNLPHVLKPVNSGSSLDTFIYPNLQTRDLNAITKAFAVHSKLLLEEFIEGTEITVPILEGFELPVIEIIPPKNETFDYENKYNGKTQEIIPPIHLHTEMQKKAQSRAREVHELLGCRHLSRIDIIVRDEKFYILEANTMPGMTDQSLFPKSAKVAGLEITNLVAVFVNLALSQKGNSKA